MNLIGDIASSIKDAGGEQINMRCEEYFKKNGPVLIG